MDTNERNARFVRVYGTPASIELIEAVGALVNAYRKGGPRNAHDVLVYVHRLVEVWERAPKEEDD